MSLLLRLKMISPKKSNQFKKGLNRTLIFTNGRISSFIRIEKRAGPCQHTKMGKSHKVCSKSSESMRGVEVGNLVASCPRAIGSYIPILNFTADIYIPAT